MLDKYAFGPADDGIFDISNSIQVVGIGIYSAKVMYAIKSTPPHSATEYCF